MAWYNRKKKSQSKAFTPNRFDTCFDCGRNFNWKFEGTCNGNGENFCNSYCLRSYYEKVKPEEGENLPFDAL